MVCRAIGLRHLAWRRRIEAASNILPCQLSEKWVSSEVNLGCEKMYILSRKWMALSLKSWILVIQKVEINYENHSNRTSTNGFDSSAS